MFGCSTLARKRRFGHGGGHRVSVACVQQALEHHPAVVHVAVDAPGRSSRGRRARGSPAPRTARPRGRREKAWARTSTACRSGCRSPPGVRGVRPGPARRACRIRDAAEPVDLRHLRVGHDRGGWIDLRYARYRDNSGTESPASAGRPRRLGASRPYRRLASHRGPARRVSSGLPSFLGDQSKSWSVLVPCRRRAWGRSEAAQPGVVEALPCSVSAHLRRGRR